MGRGPYQRGPWPGNPIWKSGFITFLGWHFLVAGLTRQELGLGPTRGPRQIIGSRCHLCSMLISINIPPVRKKNPDHLYSLINHRRTTVNKGKKGKKGKGEKGKR